MGPPTACHIYYACQVREEISKDRNEMKAVLVGGWASHLKNTSQNGNLPPSRGENKKYLKPPPRVDVWLWGCKSFLSGTWSADCTIVSGSKGPPKPYPAHAHLAFIIVKVCKSGGCLGMHSKPKKMLQRSASACICLHHVFEKKQSGTNLETI